MAEARNYRKKANGKNATGRPSKYSAAMCRKLVGYFDQEPYELVVENRVNRAGDAVEVIESRPADFPTVEGFCAGARISKETFYRWVEEHEEFRDAFARARACQSNILVVNAMRGLYNSGFAQFAAINCMGWKSSKNENQNEQNGKIEVVFGGGEEGIGEEFAK